MYRNKADISSSNTAAAREQAIRAKKLINALTVKISLPPAPLSILSGGVTDEQTRPFLISPGRALSSKEGSFVNPLYLAHNRFDFTFIIMAVLSLLAVFITYDSISSEISSQTLRLVLSSHVSKKDFILSKIAGGIFITLLPFSVFYLILVSYLLVIPFFPFSLAAGIKLALLYLLSCVYLSFFCLVGILFSLLFENRTKSLSLCAIT